MKFGSHAAKMGPEFLPIPSVNSSFPGFAHGGQQTELNCDTVESKSR